jgi:hypothetical protein
MLHAARRSEVAESGQERHPLVLAARAGAGRDLQDREARHDARQRLRATEKRALDSQARSQFPATRFLHPVRHAEAQEVPRARRVQGRRSARHDVALRPGDGNHHGSGGGRDVERVHAVGGGRAAAAGSRTHLASLRSSASTVCPISCRRRSPATPARAPTSLSSASPTRRRKAAAARFRPSPPSSRATRSSLRRSSASPAPARSTGRAASPAWSSSRRTQDLRRRFGRS